MQKVRIGKRKFLPVLMNKKLCKVFMDDLKFVHVRVHKASPRLPKYHEDSAEA